MKRYSLLKLGKRSVILSRILYAILEEAMVGKPNAAFRFSYSCPYHGQMFKTIEEVKHFNGRIG